MHSRHDANSYNNYSVASSCCVAGKPQGNEAVGDAISGVSRLFAVVVVATMALFLITVWGMVLFRIWFHRDPEMDRP